MLYYLFVFDLQRFPAKSGTKESWQQVFEKIKKFFGLGTEKKAAEAAKAPGKKKPSRPAEKKPSPQKSRKRPEAKAVREKSVPKPEHPAELKDVPAVEGKLRFLDLPLHREVQFGVQSSGFEYCTPIQELALPALLEKRDLAARAQTGTGKTAAFLLAAFTRLLNEVPETQKESSPRMLVLAPTRELAAQIFADAEKLGVFTGLHSAVVFGGMDYEKQRRNLAGKLDVLAGTPGRIIDYSSSGAVDLSRVEILVIDEADRMLDMGFIPDVKRIVSRLPKKGERQTLLFSATLDESILRLASGWLADPFVVESEPDQLVSENIEQKFYSVLRDEKLALTLYILNNFEYERLIIFGNRKDVNLRLQHDLARYGHRVPVLSGDIAQEKRIRILEKFRSGAEKVIIATDVAARGIHVDNVSLVINYDLPERSEDYIHRIGRTGRAGNKGLAISFLCEYGAYYLPDIEELLKVQFSSELPEEKMLELPPEVAPSASIPDLPRRRPSGGRRPRRR